MWFDRVQISQSILGLLTIQVSVFSSTECTFIWSTAAQSVFIFEMRLSRHSKCFSYFKNLVGILDYLSLLYSNFRMRLIILSSGSFFFFLSFLFGWGVLIGDEVLRKLYMRFTVKFRGIMTSVRTTTLTKYYSNNTTWDF